MKKVINFLLGIVFVIGITFAGLTTYNIFIVDGNAKIGNISEGSYLQVDDNGFVRLMSGATARDDLRVPLDATAKGGSKDPGFSVFRTDGSGSQGVFTYFFDKSSEEELYFSVQLPHSRKQGTDLEPHIHWTPIDTNTGSVVRGLECVWENLGDIYGNTTIYTGDGTTDGTAYKHILTDLGTINGSGKTLSSMLACRIYRDAVNDTYNNDAAALEVDFHYEIEGFGSDTEYTK